jgi:hypothetical protein
MRRAHRELCPILSLLFLLSQESLQERGRRTAHGGRRTAGVVAKIIIAVAVIGADALLIGPAAQHALVSGHSSSFLSRATIGHAPLPSPSPPSCQRASHAAAPHGRVSASWPTAEPRWALISQERGKPPG